MQTTSPVSVNQRFRLRSRTGNRADRAFKWIVTGFGVLILLIMALLVYELIAEALPAVRHFGLGFMVSRTWNPVTDEYGALPFVIGTLVSSLIALLIAGPISIGVAAFLVEIAPGWVRRPAGFAVELLAAVPSVVYGFWGIFVLVPFLKSHLYPVFISGLDFIPIFSGPTYGPSLFAAGLILAIMILPTIASITRDVMLVVPRGQREAMLALGTTRWEVIRTVVLPQSRSGIVGAGVLGLGRALGETMAVVMVIGNSLKLPSSLFQPATTMTAIIVNDFNEASGLQQAALLEIALLLFVVVAILNIGARLLVWRVSRGGARRAASR